MSKTSGFRTIEFKEINCTELIFNEYSKPYFLNCVNGILTEKLINNVNIEYGKCKRCLGTGKLEITESKVE